MHPRRLAHLGKKMLDLAKIAELKAEVVKLRDDIEEIKQQTQDISPDVPSSVVNQLNEASPSICEEDKKADEFLDPVHKKRIGDEIRQRDLH
ncbi:unnamed protein product [Rhizophagus irregularis]|nr:unnamed protein product [Rhizophagus irregularis]